MRSHVVAFPSCMEEDEDSHGESFVPLQAIPSYLVSLGIHMALLVMMALFTVPETRKQILSTLTAAVNDDLEPLEDVALDMPMKPLELTETIDAPSADDYSNEPLESSLPESSIIEMPSDVESTTGATVELANIGPGDLPTSDVLFKRLPQGTSNPTADRIPGNHFVPGTGISQESERAVANALKWLAAHQQPDGGWQFDHRQGPCAGRCGQPGSIDDCPAGATAMALLPFLGAGQTHKEGQYRKTVERGLYFLVSRMKVQNQAGSLAEGAGNMYAHGLASITLCEAYAMTHDKGLIAPAQLSLNHIVAAQDPVGGGWRYQPRQPGDTSVVGWQLMALKSGHMGYLTVPQSSIVGASKFLDSVQSDDGARYGYTNSGRGEAVSAVGLLCRMYLGWKKDHPALVRGVKAIAVQGPSKTNLYYDYYATQVMRHFGGEDWDRWNVTMRDHLIDTQAAGGHEAGSWHFKGNDPGADRGGRLYATSLATMILEVYYRHLPIYGKQAADDDWVP